MKQSSINVLRLLAVGSSLIVLTACATGKGKAIRSVDAMVDDGKRNTMLVSYNVTMNVTDKFAPVTSSDLIVNCGEPSRLGNVPECFRLKVPLRGRRTVEGYEYYSFSDSGAKVIQMPYGSFGVKAVGHNVVVDVERYSRCYRDSFDYYSPYLRPHSYNSNHRHNSGFSRRSRHRNHFDCIPVNVNITARHYSEIPEPSTIDIGPGEGCYAGHLKLEMTDGRITRYTLDQDADMPSGEALNNLSGEFQQAIKDREFSRCVTS